MLHGPCTFGDQSGRKSPMPQIMTHTHCIMEHEDAECAVHHASSIQLYQKSLGTAHRHPPPSPAVATSRHRPSAATTRCRMPPPQAAQHLIMQRITKYLTIRYLFFIEQVIDSTLSDWCIVVLQRNLPHHHYSIEKIPQDNCFLIVHQPRGPIRVCGIFVRPWVVSDSDLCVATHGPI